MAFAKAASAPIRRERRRQGQFPGRIFMRCKVFISEPGLNRGRKAAPARAQAFAHASNYRFKPSELLTLHWTHLAFACRRQSDRQSALSYSRLTAKSRRSALSTICRVASVNLKK